MENNFLRRIGELSGQEVIFKHEELLSGTATIGGMPIDIAFDGERVKLIGVGIWSGASKEMSRGPWRGKGMFKSLVPHIKQALTEFGFSNELYLTPVSPVWKKCYNLVEDELGWKIVL